MLQIARDEPELTLRDYARLMMGISDNIATDFLMGLLGLGQINTTLDRLGYANVRAAATMGRYHYRMVGMDEMPTNRANDAVVTGSGSALGALTTAACPLGIRWKTMWPLLANWPLYWRLCTTDRSSVRRPPKP